jgi:hypothetical protein
VFRAFAVYHTGFTTGIPIDRICDPARVRNLFDLASA